MPQSDGLVQSFPSFVLAGVDDVTSPSFDLDKTLQDAGSGPAILLCHSPDILGEASRRGIPLVLSGHTHGGRFVFPSWAHRRPRP